MALKRRVFPRARNVIPWPGGSTIALTWASLATQLSPRLSPASCVSAGVLRESHLWKEGRQGFESTPGYPRAHLASRGKALELTGDGLERLDAALSATQDQRTLHRR